MEFYFFYLKRKKCISVTKIKREQPTDGDGSIVYSQALNRFGQVVRAPLIVNFAPLDEIQAVLAEHS